MRILISPAKKMNIDLDSLPYTALPRLLPETMMLLQRLQTMDNAALCTLWNCSDALAQLNIKRVRTMNLTQGLTPAILSYEGIQYRYMAPGVFDCAQLAFIDEHLRILSGFYGILRPFDGVRPYRLEMGARLALNDSRDLYAFWGNRLAERLALETDCVINLASTEYARAVEPHLPANVRFVTCVFGELLNDKIIEKGTLCKMARGAMVRFLAERGISKASELPLFNHLGYVYSAPHSTPDRVVFLKQKD